VLGTDDLYRYLQKYSLKLDEGYNGLIEKCPKKPWTKFINSDNQHLCNEEAVDLLSKMLIYDRCERITPREAMDHPYFAPVKKM